MKKTVIFHMSYDGEKNRGNRTKKCHIMFLHQRVR